ILISATNLQNIKACNLSSLMLDSINTTVSGDYQICMTLNIGAGITGATTGATGGTSTFAFGIYSSSAISVVAYSPATITGLITGCTLFAFNLGAQGPPFYTQATIGFLDFGCTNGFTC